MNEPFRNLDFDPRNLPPAYAEAIGRAVACYAQTEDHIQMAIAGCLGLDIETGWALTTHMSVPLRESVLKSVAHIKVTDDAALSELLGHMEKFSEATARRNSIAHQMWCIDMDTKEVFSLKTTARKTVSAGLVPRPIEKLLLDVEFIYKVGIDLLEFLLGRGLVPSLPPRNRARSRDVKATRK